MALSLTQQTIIAKAQVSGSGDLGTGLDDAACGFTVATIVKDLGLTSKFPEIPRDVPDFFEERDPRKLRLEGLDFLNLIERLFTLISDSDTYFTCLAKLQKVV